jgi:hypothetical protein
VQLPANARAFARCSIYHWRGDFHIAGLDASAEEVGDGINNSASAGSGNDSDDDDEGDDNEASDEEDDDGAEDEYEEGWEPLTFTADPNRYISYVGRRLPLQRLPFTRPDQIWPDQLFPDGYSALNTINNTQYGGLVGELPLLLALMAFAMPAEYVAAGYLAQYIGNTWTAPPPTHYPRRCGCEWTQKALERQKTSCTDTSTGLDGRGIVVTIYHVPSVTSQADLLRYQRGEFGPILS